MLRKTAHGSVASLTQARGRQANRLVMYGRRLDIKYHRTVCSVMRMNYSAVCVLTTPGQVTPQWDASKAASGLLYQPC